MHRGSSLHVPSSWFVLLCFLVSFWFWVFIFHMWSSDWLQKIANLKVVKVARMIWQRPDTGGRCSCRKHRRQGKCRRGRTPSSSRGIRGKSPGGRNMIYFKLLFIVVKGSLQTSSFYRCQALQLLLFIVINFQALSSKSFSPKPSPSFHPFPFFCLEKEKQVPESFRTTTTICFVWYDLNKVW